jgi:signal transduction histidine kinase
MARPAPRTPVLLFVFLSFYILLQSAWWMWLLLSKDRDIFALQQQLISSGIAPHLPVRLPQHMLMMVLGEGSVFLVLLLLALWVTFRTLRHELSLARQQRDFLMAASHELRTPIAALKLHLQTLERPGLGSGPRDLLVRSAGSDVDRLYQLTERILLASRLEEKAVPPLWADVDVARETGAVVEAARLGYGQGHVIVLDQPDELRIRTDPALFRSILVNLLENACKYAPPGTEVRVGLAKTDRAFSMLVSDAGPGVPAADRHRIFEKFFRGGREETRNTKGTGLGLFIVKRLVESLGGQVEYRPLLPHGSTFAASFPLHT